jgi:putative salt-induced outer membrane protein
MSRLPIVLLLLSTSAANAAATTPEAGWQPSAELGIVNTTGNSDTTSINGRFGLSGESDAWTHDYALSGLRSENEDELAANRLEFAGKTARRLTPRSYLGAAGRYEHDDFGAYSEQSTLALNYGLHALRAEDVTLLFEGGPGLRRAELADTGEHEEAALLRGFADYEHQFTESARFFNTTLVEASGDNTFVQNDIGVAVSINRSLALKAALQARHNSTVPAGSEATDTLTSVNIVWAPKHD